jgi:uncharacterized 2Fe-2S/4Fe-4S cluster protein (DUF4445 family)
MSRNEDVLLVDIGTNGEMALWKKTPDGSGGRFLCCSTAAGPCFEGAEISCGMGALPGAINSFKPDKFTTIGNAPPRGICGAGLIDAIAAMKQLGAIDETGALAECYAQGGFPLADGIALSQKDIRQFQLAKSAVYSGIALLCKKAGMTPETLDAVYIAGGLGFYINPESAVTTGLLPSGFAAAPAGKNRVSICGNTSLKGAVQCLTDSDFLPRCRQIIANSDLIELASNSDFTDAFADNMFF